MKFVEKKTNCKGMNSMKQYLSVDFKVRKKQLTEALEKSLGRPLVVHEIRIKLRYFGIVT
jgi:hypothetical protein